MSVRYFQRPPIPCPHPERVKVSRDACRSCYHRTLYGPAAAAAMLAVAAPAPEVKAEVEHVPDRRPEAARIVVDALYATLPGLVGHIAAELFRRVSLPTR